MKTTDTAQAAKKMSLAGLIDYQKGSVVSREIVHKRAGTATVFAFDRGEGLSEHTAPYDALVTILDGSAVITISGKNYPLSMGEAIILPAGKPHALHAPKRFKMLLVMIRSR